MYLLSVSLRNSYSGTEKVPKELVDKDFTEKSLPGPPALGPPESPGKSLEKVFRDLLRDFFQTLQTFSRLFPDSRGVLGREAPGDFFQTFSGFRARRARETPVNGQRVPKQCPEIVEKIHWCCSADLLASCVRFWPLSYAIIGVKTLSGPKRQKGVSGGSLRQPKKSQNESRVAISLECYRIQKPLKSGNTKKIRKNYKITHFRFGPENTKKLPKNYKNGHFLANFVFFSYFRGQAGHG